MAADELIHEEVIRGLATRGRARISGNYTICVASRPGSWVVLLGVAVAANTRGSCSSAQQTIVPVAILRGCVDSATLRW